MSHPPPALTTGPRQRTTQALTRWLRALPAPSYDVRIVPADGTGPVLQRQFTAERLLASVPWLRARNARHCHVYARPADARHVLVDDLDPDSLSWLLASHRPAAVVETSPWCYQAWLTVSSEPVAPALAAATARRLAAQFEADAGAASAVQLGRLPGFTNRKPRHERGDGSYPYVLLHRASACFDPGGPALLAAGLLDDKSLATAVSDECQPAADRVPSSASPRLVLRSPEVEYREGLRRVLASLPAGASLDRSRADFAVARRLLARGAAPAHVGKVLSTGPRAQELPARAAAVYVERTLAAAAQLCRRGAALQLITPCSAAPRKRGEGRF